MDEDLVSITGGPLRPHEYVLVISEMTAADEAWIQNHSAKTSGSGQNMEITLMLGDVQLATLKRVVKGWNLTKPTRRADGSVEEVPLPFTLQNIERLPRRVYRYILRKYNEMNPDEEESDEDFLPVVVDSSEESLDAERVVRLKR